MFGRATIRLGIGPHSSCVCFVGTVASYISRIISADFHFYRATPSRCSTEKAKLRITQTTPHDSPGNYDAEDFGKTQTG